MSKDEQEQSNNTNNSESNDDNSSSSSEQQTPEIKSTSTNDYEKQREARISANNARMEALGLRNMANILMGTPPNRQRGRISNRNPKRVGKNKRDSDDDEYEPDVDGIDVGVSSGDDEDDDEDGDFEEEDETFVRRIRKSSVKKAKNIKSKSGKQVSMTDPTDIPVFMDEDEALKQAISLSLKDIGEISLQQNSMSSQNLSTRNACGKEKSRDHIQEDNTKRRRRKLFTSRVQMTEDDLVIHFCQIDEVGKGSISLRDVERMAATHDFAWTDKELSDMVRCFDSDRDGKLTLDDFRNIVQRCNMLVSQEDF